MSGKTRANWPEIQALYELSSLPVREIATRAGISHQRILAVAKRKSWQRPEDARQQSKALATIPPESIETCRPYSPDEPAGSPLESVLMTAQSLLARLGDAVEGASLPSDLRSISSTLRDVLFVLEGLRDSQPDHAQEIYQARAAWDIEISRGLTELELAAYYALSEKVVCPEMPTMYDNLILQGFTHSRILSELGFPAYRGEVTDVTPEPVKPAPPANVTPQPTARPMRIPGLN